jgi:hypothetical protein
MAMSMIKTIPILSNFYKMKQNDIEKKLSPSDVLNFINIIEELYNQNSGDEFISWLYKHLSKSLWCFKMAANFYKEMTEYETKIATPNLYTVSELGNMKTRYKIVKTTFEAMKRSAYTSLRIIHINIHMKIKYNYSLI